MADNHVESRCDQCGQVDNHPKVLSFPSGNVYHHDCLNADLKQEVIDSNEHGQKVIEAASSGKHGDELRELINSLNASENEV